ncbi:MAG: hypothetical protein LN588_02775 [Rickettsia endosymbiont of Bryobia graminum]|nr:hypothetical protein [Rickettsia endosymbiont of Bryobia graminum]
MKEQPTTAIKVRSNTPFIFTIILIILFIISVSYMAFYKTELFNKNIISLKEPIENSIIDHHTHEIENNQVKKEQTVSINQDHSENTELPEIINDSISSRTKIAKQPQPFFDDYRNYLFNVNLLISHFLQDKNFSEQILKIQSIELPIEIQNTLINLQNYNDNYLTKGDEKSIKIFPKNIPWVEKFIKIEKQAPLNQEQMNLKQKIMEQLDSFINFFYSEKLQQKFVEKNHD